MLLVLTKNKIRAVLTSIVLFMLLANMALDPYNKNLVFRTIQQLAKGICLVIYIPYIIHYGNKYVVNVVFRSTLFFLGLIFTYSLFSPYVQNLFPNSYVLLSFLFFYIQAKKDAINSKHLLYFTIGLIIVAINGILIYWGKDYLSDMDKLSDAGGNNYGYMATSALFLLFLYPRKRIYLVIFILGFVFTLFAKKRGASIGAIMALLYYLKFYFQKLNFKRILVYFLIITFFFIPFLWHYHELFFGRFLDSSSGRVDLYMVFIESWFNSSILNFLFGHGYYATMDIVINGASRYAHSDFVEVLYDFGLMGMILYLYMFFSFWYIYYKYYRKNKMDKNSDMYQGFFVLLIYLFIKALISGVYLDVDCAVLMIALGVYSSSKKIPIK